MIRWVEKAVIQMEHTMCHIFVVADNLILAGLIKLCLEQEGYQVSIHARCDEVVQHAADQPPDCCIIDMTQHHPGGSDICLQHCEHYSIPTILLAIPGISEHRIKTGPLKHRLLLIKPFTTDMLLQIVQTALESRQSVSAA
jgi:two-component system, OmpR family, response regulator